MPTLVVSQALTANQKGFNAFSGWQYEFAPYPCTIKMMARTTGAAGADLMTIYSGSETIQESSPIQAGGTAGVTPSELNTPPVIFHAAAGDRLKTKIDETAGATPTIDIMIYLEPLI